MSNPVVLSAKDQELTQNVLLSPLYKKSIVVQARKAHEGEVVRTILEDGFEETVHTAKDTEWVVTNPQGEQYVLTDNLFRARYTPSSRGGEYFSRGECHAVENPYQQPVELVRTGKEIEQGGADCFIALAVDEHRVPLGELYLIDRESFLATYVKV